MIIQTEHLILRPYTEADAALTYKYSQEPSRISGIPNEVYDSEQEALSVIEYLMKQYKDVSMPYVLAIDHRNSGYIGHIGISEINAGAEIGYAICEAAQGKGYATEAVRAFTLWAVDAFQLDALYGLARRHNIASKRVLEKVGYAFIQDDLQGEYAPGGEYTVYCYLKA